MEMMRVPSSRGECAITTSLPASRPKVTGQRRDQPFHWLFGERHGHGAAIASGRAGQAWRRLHAGVGSGGVNRKFFQLRAVLSYLKFIGGHHLAFVVKRQLETLGQQALQHEAGLRSEEHTSE